MLSPKEKTRPVESKPFFVRKLTKAGSSRYLSIGTILSPDWEAVKVTVEQLDETVCLLRIEPIK